MLDGVSSRSGEGAGWGSSRALLDVWRCDSGWNLDDPGASAGSSGGDGRSVRFAACTAGSVHAAATANADAAGQLARYADLERARNAAADTARSDPIGSASRSNSSAAPPNTQGADPGLRSAADCREPASASTASGNSAGASTSCRPADSCRRGARDISSACHSAATAAGIGSSSAGCACRSSA